MPDNETNDPKRDPEPAGGLPVPEPADGTPHGPQCACCGGGDGPSEEEMDAVQADPAGRSLSRALSVSFFLLKLVMVAILAFFLLDCVTWVEQGEVGLKKRFGAFVTDAKGATRVYKAGEPIFVLPAPLEELVRIPSESEMSLKLDRSFWPATQMAPNVEQQTELPSQDMLDPAKDRYNLTGDSNILHSRWTVLYRISAPERYVLAVANAQIPKEASGNTMPVPGLGQAAETRRLRPEDMLKREAESVIFSHVAGAGVDDILGERNSEIFNRIVDDLKSAVMTEGGEYRWGLEVIAVTNDRILPPGKTQAAFNAVSSALSEKKSRQDAARGEAKKTLNDADQLRNRIVTDAESVRSRVVANAEADAQRLRDLLAKFPDDPEALRVYLQQYRIVLLTEVLTQTNRYLLRPGQAWFMTGPQPGLYLEKDKKK